MHECTMKQDLIRYHNEHLYVCEVLCPIEPIADKQFDTGQTMNLPYIFVVTVLWSATSSHSIKMSRMKLTNCALGYIKLHPKSFKKYSFQHPPNFSLRPLGAYSKCDAQQAWCLCLMPAPEAHACGTMHMWHLQVYVRNCNFAFILFRVFALEKAKSR